MAITKRWNFTTLTGGGARALDAIPIASIAEGHRAEGIIGSELTIYAFDAAATDAEDSPYVIRPDDFGTVGNGVWKRKRGPLDNGNAVGSPLFWFLDTPPTDYLECNGASVSRTTYAELFAVIGTTYGPGNGTTTFQIPSTSGRYLRVIDHGAGVDSGAASRVARPDGTTGDVVGTYQNSQNKSHQHLVAPPSFVSEDAGAHTHASTAADIVGGATIASGSGIGDAAAVISPVADHAHWINVPPTNTVLDGGIEANVRNIAILLCIKYQ